MSDADAPGAPEEGARGEGHTEEGTGLVAPADYLASLASSAQVVLLGDTTGVSQHVEFLAEAVPTLAGGGPTGRAGGGQAGFDCIAWEFTNARAQSSLDALIDAETFDEARCADTFVDLMGVGFAYQQYADVLGAVWEHNRRCAAADASGASSLRPLRMVALGQPSYVEDPQLLSGRSGGELVLRNWLMGAHHRDGVAFGAHSVLTREVLRAGKRALVYADVSSTATRTIEWRDGVACVTLGNLLHRWMGEGVVRVVMHGAIADAAATQRTEELIAASPDAARATDGAALTFGLDLSRSPLGNVGLSSLTASLDGTAERSSGQLRLRDVADGYVYVAARRDWKPAELLDGLLRDDNFAAAEQRYRALVPREVPYELAELEQVRSEGQQSLPDGWPPLPEEPDEPAKRRWFRRDS